jgi:hypothetical protein
MAYSIRPTSAAQLSRSLGAYAPTKHADILSLYSYLTRTYSGVSNPLILNDRNGGNAVKVHPAVLQSDSSLDVSDVRGAGRALARAAGVTLNVLFGVGSSGGRGPGYNMGNAAEGVLAAAIAARFINKEKRINNNDVLRVLTEMSRHLTRAGNSTEHTFKSRNFKTSRETKIVPDDDVRVLINLSPVNMRLVFADTLLEGDDRAQGIFDRNQIIGPCVQYANSREISQLANVMYYNRVKDTIEVLADGIGGELTTKVDVYLLINGQKSITVPANYRMGTTHTLNITQISLKREVDQFAQVGGWDIETAQSFWGLILNEDIRNSQQVQNIYARHADQQYPTTKHHAAAVMAEVYTWANQRLQSKLNDATWKTHFVNTLDEFATKNEENVKLVEIVGSGYEKYDFSKLHVALNGRRDLEVPSNLTLQSRVVMSRPDNANSSPLPTVFIEAVNSNDNKTYRFLKLRHKIEWSGTAIRNYVEKQPGLAEYIAGQ